MMWYMTLWWAFGCAFYFALIAAITWTVPFEIAFGLVLGRESSGKRECHCSATKRRLLTNGTDCCPSISCLGSCVFCFL